MKKIQLTDTHKEKLFQIPLFRNLPLNIKESLLEKLDFVVYIANKKEIVVTQGTPCNKLYVLLEGKLRTDIIWTDRAAFTWAASDYLAWYLPSAVSCSD